MTERNHTPRKIPTPPKPERREPLPGRNPKPPADDPAAHARLEAITASPSYRLAVEDQDFLDGPAARGARLQLDYLKAEDGLRAAGIERCIVVFGSTRLCEPAAAKRRVEAARRVVAAADDRREDRRAAEVRLRAAENVLALSRYYDVARAFGQTASLADWGGLGKIRIMTGGGPGIMEAANRGAFEAGGQSVGLNIHLPHEQYPNPYITPGLCFQFHYFAMRKLHFLQRAVALVAFPGGYGTFDELFEVLTLAQTRKIKPIPIVLVGEAFWRGAVNFDFLAEQGVIDPEDRELFWFAETAEDIFDAIMQWERGKS
ncbi:Rossman fold protein, TIGR00730 family [Rhodoblastus sphagnicola]|uniref:AMP nucleosidase n=1 Tax=Rhodoblastus sphagnicola TaxID=333368 RepID=A0A2S6N2D2_9HYPH|nr:TIGR00730 family Rossman fold protein [Rhodoblastus sphagnicola]MBB4197320.1 hypothetical protein [Rhodoblastus sphagnicola]PPQ28775.1 Rossman fold protein, TIGR00730 family [Rhodoblastus sphagnicola]